MTIYIKQSIPSSRVSKTEVCDEQLNLTGDCQYSSKHH